MPIVYALYIIMTYHFLKYAFILKILMFSSYLCGYQ